MVNNFSLLEFFRRSTGAFTPKNATRKQLLTSYNGYRLRDTDERIVREREVSKDTTKTKRAGVKSGKDTGAAITINGKDNNVVH